MELTTLLLAVGGWTLCNARTDQIRPADAPSRALDPVCGASILATDFYGNDLPSTVYADSVTGCCTACQNVSGCVAVTWNAAGDHHCNLKYSTAGRRTAIGEVSAILLHPAPPSPPPPPPPLPPGSPAEWLPRAAAGQLVYEVSPSVGGEPVECDLAVTKLVSPFALFAVLGCCVGTPERFNQGQTVGAKIGFSVERIECCRKFSLHHSSCLTSHWVHRWGQLSALVQT